MEQEEQLSDLIIGFFLGPLGIILGPFIGAFVGEMIFKDDINYAFKAGFGSLLGFPDRYRTETCCFICYDILFCEGVDSLDMAQGTGQELKN